MAASNQSNSDARATEYLRLLGQHERRLGGFILSLVPNWADADDIAQEVKIRLWEQFDSYDPTKDFGAWARTIAYYQVLTHRETHRRRHELVDSAILDALIKETSKLSKKLDAGQEALEDCFEKLPLEKQELLLTYYSGERTTREIADELGRTFDATRQAILRTRMALSDCIEKTMRQGGG